MNPSSLNIILSAVQRQKDMYKYAGSELFDDEGRRALLKIFLMRGNNRNEVELMSPPKEDE